MTCRDCIYYDVCQYHITEETDMTVAECSHSFKNKADFVEVVYCENCESYNGHRYCNYSAMPVLDGDFCSYGKRKVATDICAGSK